MKKHSLKRKRKNSYLHLISHRLNMFPYLIPKYVVRYNLRVDINHIHDEDDEVPKKFDHEPRTNSNITED
jgi:hypothetical protein